MAITPGSEPTATVSDTSSNGSQAGPSEPTPLPATEVSNPAPPHPRSEEPPPAPRGVVAASRSRWVVIHPHVSFFSWLADKQGPIDAPAEVRLERYRRESPGLFKLCVILDLLVLLAVSVILVTALAAALYKVIWGLA
jgi:hypothetical protein